MPHIVVNDDKKNDTDGWTDKVNYRVSTLLKSILIFKGYGYNDGVVYNLWLKLLDTQLNAPAN